MSKHPFCSVVLPAWYAVLGEPNGAMLLHHLSQSHPVELRPHLDQMVAADETDTCERR